MSDAPTQSDTGAGDDGTEPTGIPRWVKVSAIVAVVLIVVLVVGMLVLGGGHGPGNHGPGNHGPGMHG